MWVGDISYLRTWEGWLYLATVIDAHSRRVIGWAIADHMRTDLVEDALKMAIILRGELPAQVVFHTDRGTQGGFKWSSQHLDDGGGLWVLGSVRGGFGGTDLARWSNDEIQAVANVLNARPRKTLGWKTPAEAFNEQLRSLQQAGGATTG